MTLPRMAILRALQVLFPNPKALYRQLPFLQLQKQQPPTNQKLMGWMSLPIHTLMSQYLVMTTMRT